MAVGAGIKNSGLDKLAIGAGLDQIRGRPAVDKLLMRRNSGSSLRELDVRVWPFRLELALINWPSGLASINSGRPAVDKLLLRRNKLAIGADQIRGAIAGRASES